MSALNAPLEPIPAAVDSVTTTVTDLLPNHAWYDVIGHYQVVLDSLQVNSGLPWWAVLLGTGVIVRSILFPANILYEKKLVKNIPHIAALSRLRTEMSSLQSKGDIIAALTKKGEMDFYKKSNNFSWKKSANWFLLPSICTMSLNFLSIRNLAEISYQPLQTTNFLWVPNLCQSDPYFLFPALNAAALAYVLKYGIDTGSNNPMTQLLSSNKVFLTITLFTFGIQSIFPSALVLYWFSSNIFGIAVVKPLMNNDTFRNKVGLLSLEDKKKVFENLPTIQDIYNETNKNYQEVRKNGHEEDLEARKAKLAKLESKDNGGSVEELRESLEKLKLELKIKDQELSKLKKETEGQIDFLKKSGELTNAEDDSIKSEQAKSNH
jgi:YidC/Oxa1 family membrane protein insertase